MKYFFTLFVLMLSLFSCKKYENLFPEKIDLVVKLEHAIDSFPLLYDTIMYFNQAGNNYEITRLEYYISNIKLHSDFLGDYTSSKIFYVNPQIPSTLSLLLEDVPSGRYTSISYTIGIDSSHNISFSLPNTAENIGMSWPNGMGGGYHFLKLEGHYLYNSISTGYAVHLGNNSFQATGIIHHDFMLGYTPYEIELEMNINEWYQSPNIYNFQVDGNYTMGDSVLMGKIASNGTDIFSLKHY